MRSVRFTLRLTIVAAALAAFVQSPVAVPCFADNPPPAGKASPAAGNKTSAPHASPASGVSAGTPAFLHPPLDCMKQYTRIDRYPIIGWCFHGPGGGGYDEQFVRTAKGAGFNVLIDSARLLEPAAKVGGVKVMPVTLRWPVERLKSEIFDRYGDPPAMLGLVIDDDCPKIYDWAIKASQFLNKEDPTLTPYISNNPSPKSQSRTLMHILSTQNYSIKNFGHNAYARRAYCSGMGRDRRDANRYHMTFWPLWETPCSTSEMRYQIYAALAYGAQGIVCFAYTPSRPNWKVGASSYVDAREINRTVAETFGPRIWGTRSPGVYHYQGDGEAPVTELKPAAGELIERLDPALLASPLVLEKDFYAPGGPHAPTYVMVVDKRTSPDNQSEPKPRTARVDFGPQIRFVETLGPVQSPAGRVRHINPAWSVPLKLKAGEGVLLGVDPPDLQRLLGDDLAPPYLAIVERVRAARQLARAKGAAAGAIDQALSESRKQLAELQARLPRPENGAESPAAAQRRDLVERLSARLEDLATARRATQPSDKH